MAKDAVFHSLRQDGDHGGQEPTDGSAPPPTDTMGAGTRPRVAFLFIGQAHQLLHGITIAEELALAGRVDVDIVSTTAINLELACDIVVPETRHLLGFERIGSRVLRASAARLGRVLPPKLPSLFIAHRRLDRYDAIILPERTSTILRKLGVRRPKLIHIDHGAGDRAVGYDKRIAQFDFALVAGRKQERRMLADGLIRPGAYAIVGYPKFDAADRIRDRSWHPFADDRPVILYNPHFSAELGSWAKDGQEIVRNIVESGRFNLVIAPHVRLCDTRKGRSAAEAVFGMFRPFPQVHLDLGSERSIDMTYTSLADVYLGDVSSQVYEFIRTPRPCVFINSHGKDWHGDPNYSHWNLGPVFDHAAMTVAAIDASMRDHGDYRDRQRAAFGDTVDEHAGRGSSIRAAEAIVSFLCRAGVADLRG
ncbi:hypothetical protein [Rhizorhabdus sp.]|uniref:hypothetical protein n=1 Tax=Rhizorhabdus sp. TaxID=1968843 RepID=UPI0019B44C93|nr:hypothetical protein [Rhizorhabdus sp.]MBD3762383.1 hypothetical protein [Rhizorhabdus sp.]